MLQGNSLLPQTSPSLPPGMMEGLQGEYKSALAQFDKAKKSFMTVTKVATEVEKLVDMGDSVTLDDVVSAAGKMVGFGLTATAIASLLAGAGGGPPVPQKEGQALASWCKTQAEQLEQRKQQVTVALDKARHAALVSGEHILQATHVGGTQGAESGAQSAMSPASTSAPSPSNPLLASSGDNSGRS